MKSGKLRAGVRQLQLKANPARSTRSRGDHNDDDEGAEVACDACLIWYKRLAVRDLTLDFTKTILPRNTLFRPTTLY